MILESILFTLFLPSISANIKDFGLEKACEFMNGQFNQRHPPNREAPRGDTCKMTFRAPTKNEKEANEFCNLYAPWRLIEATHGEKTSCHVEATLMCDPGWIQMLGRCYRMAPKLEIHTYDNAEKQCQQMKRNGKIAYLNHRYLVGMWKNYFRGIRQVWMRASETADQLLQLDEDPAGKLALAFIGLHYSFQVPFNSLIRLKADKQLQVLCEYEPPITIAEINYLGRRYGEIYYKSTGVTNGIVTRTGSQYNQGTSVMDICKNALKPFMVEDVYPFILDDTALGELASVKNEGIPFLRSGYEAPLEKYYVGSTFCSKRTVDCFLTLPGDRNKIRLKDQISECANMNSVAITYPKATLKTMSDNRFAPLLCKIGKAKKYTLVVPTGYTRIDRGNQMPFGLRVVKKKMKFYDAHAECRKDGAYLAGADSDAEFIDIRKAIMSAGVNNNQLWLGARRKRSCWNHHSFSRDPSHPCARSRVFEWLDNIATAPFYDSFWALALPSYGDSPNYANSNQQCLTIAVGNVGWNIGFENRGFLDDVACDAQLFFVCGKYLEQKEIV